jgi:cation-transporting ATPase E
MEATRAARDVQAPDSAPRGLTDDDVADRAARGLVNRASRSHCAEYRDILSRNLFTLFNALVVPAAVALFLLREWRGAVAVSGLAVINSVLGLAQELRAKWHLDRLALLAEPRARVVRDGRPQEIPAGDVVQDDHLLLSAGEPVLADGPVLWSRHLEIDEALLTGESDPVPAPPGRPLLSGSFCVAGEGVYRAARVGNAAYAHQTGMEARRYAFLASPLQHTINRLIEILTGIAVALCLLYVALYFVRGFSTTALVQMVAATVTSMVPQGLVLFTTLAFILGAVRMSRRGAVVQRLSAVESMAAVNVLCLDKTGTLTTNRLCLDRVRTLSPGAEEEVRRLLALFARASLDEGNKTIQALRTALGQGPAQALEVLDHLPFKSQNRYSAVRLRGEDGRPVTLVLGACEALQPFFPEDVSAEWETVWRELLPTGLRLLLFAAPEGEDGAPLAGRRPALRLRPLALIGLSDELRPDAGEVLAALVAQGINFKIISGDHPETVRATVGRLGLCLGPEDVVTGAELAGAPDPGRLLEERSIFARVAPRQKVEIVEALQRKGNRVAMVGDGVNDVLAIKRADLGIAMGEGSAATRTVAGLVLENNRFALLPATLEEGRNILRNLRRAGKVFLLKNVYTLFLILVAFAVLGLGFPYEPQQVTLLNKVTIGVPVFVITVSRTSAARGRHAGFLWSIGAFALSTGLVIGLAGLAVCLLADAEHRQTMLLSTLVLLGLASLPRVLTAEGEELTPTDRGFLLWLPAALVLYAGAMYWPPAAYFFELVPLDLPRWGIVLAAAGAALVVCVVMDRAGRRFSPPDASPWGGCAGRGTPTGRWPATPAAGK